MGEEEEVRSMVAAEAEDAAGATMEDTSGLPRAWPRATLRTCSGSLWTRYACHV
jgi:hypothetical protein